MLSYTRQHYSQLLIAYVLAFAVCTAGAVFLSLHAFLTASNLTTIEMLESFGRVRSALNPDLRFRSGRGPNKKDSAAHRGNNSNNNAGDDNEDNDAEYDDDEYNETETDYDAEAGHVHSISNGSVTSSTTTLLSSSNAVSGAARPSAHSVFVPAASRVGRRTGCAAVLLLLLRSCGDVRYFVTSRVRRGRYSRGSAAGNVTALWGRGALWRHVLVPTWDERGGDRDCELNPEREDCSY